MKTRKNCEQMTSKNDDSLNINPRDETHGKAAAVCQAEVVKPRQFLFILFQWNVYWTLLNRPLPYHGLQADCCLLFARI